MKIKKDWQEIKKKSEKRSEEKNEEKNKDLEALIEIIDLIEEHNIELRKQVLTEISDMI